MTSKQQKENRKLAEAIGEAIQKARVAKGWNRRDLERESGVNYDVIQKIEHGERLPMVETLQLIASALDTQPGAFFPAGTAT